MPLTWSSRSRRVVEGSQSIKSEEVQGASSHQLHSSSTHTVRDCSASRTRPKIAVWADCRSQANCIAGATWFTEMTTVMCKAPSLSPCFFFHLEFCIKRRTRTRANTLHWDVAEVASAELFSTAPNGSGILAGDFEASENVGHVSRG